MIKWIEQANNSEDISEEFSGSLENNFAQFLQRMEILSAHIDRLYERYVRKNELNDDYISQEFPADSRES